MIADDATMSRLALMAQAGDRQAYGTLLTTSRDWLARYYRRKVPPVQIDDLIQETLLSLHRRLASYDPDRSFYPWLAAIARYRFIDHLRLVYRQSVETHSEDADFAVDSGEDAIAARISLERLFEVLPNGQRTAIELVKIKGLSIREASDKTGQSEALIKVNIHRGLRRLAGMVEKA